MLSSDLPITRPDQDLYGRAEFALTVAQSICNLGVSSESFVFAITGEWGAGKSSLLRLIERYVRHLEFENLSRQKFWWQKDATPRSVLEIEAMALLYERVEPEIEKASGSSKYLLHASLEYQQQFLEEKLGNQGDVQSALFYWHMASKIGDRPATVVVRFTPWLIAGRCELASALISEIARSLNNSLDIEQRNAFKEVLQRLAEFAPLAGAGVGLFNGLSGGLINALGSASGKLVEKMTTGPTLDELRGRLRSSLQKLEGQRILVVVDDIDRLTPSEAAEMVALVKSLGDLPNVIYLLSYDHSVMCSLISEALRVTGVKYLEKIIQTQITLPPIEENDLVAVVNSDLKDVFSNVNLDDKALGALWYNVLRHYIRTPRDVRRYFNSLVLAHSSVASVTDPVDLMALYALQVFDPVVYDYIRDNISEFVT